MLGSRAQRMVGTLVAVLAFSAIAASVAQAEEAPS